MKKIIVALLLVVLCSSRLVIADVGSLTATPGHNKVMLSWINLDEDIVTLARHMHHYPGTISDGILVYSGTNTAYTDRGLINNHTYYYTAFDSVGSFSCAFTVPQRDTSPPEPPETITEDGINYSPATISTQGSPTLLTQDNSPPSTIDTITEGDNIADIDRDVSQRGNYWVIWTAATDTESGIVSYELQERKSLEGWEKVSDNISSTYYFIRGKEPGRSYHYRVRAKNGSDMYGSYIY